MRSKAKFIIVAGIVAFTTALGLFSARFWPSSETGSNFGMYYTAACMVRGHISEHIYDVIDPDLNPQIIFADPNSEFARTAVAHGIYRITLYLYPPTLADLVVPFTFFPFPPAFVTWNILDVLLIIGMSIALARKLEMKFRGATVLISAAILLYRPTLHTFHWGQVTIVLVFLLTVGFSLYVDERKILAALLFALAIAIKLEPVAIIIPLIAWRDWKALRNLSFWIAVIGLGLWVINGGRALNLYFLHQLPAMSGGDLGVDVNRSLGNLFYTGLGGSISSHAISWIYRMAAALILCCALWLSRSVPGEKLTARNQFEIGLVFVFFSCCLAPYSWYYNWALSAPFMVLLCHRAWTGCADIVESALISVLLLSLATSKSYMAIFSPTIGVSLAILVLYRMRLERLSASSASAIHLSEPIGIS